MQSIRAVPGPGPAGAVCSGSYKVMLKEPVPHGPLQQKEGTAESPAENVISDKQTSPGSYLPEPSGQSAPCKKMGKHCKCVPVLSYSPIFFSKASGISLGLNQCSAKDSVSFSKQAKLAPFVIINVMCCKTSPVKNNLVNESNAFCQCASKIVNFAKIVGNSAGKASKLTDKWYFKKRFSFCKNILECANCSKMLNNT
ncbi:hypothetical protein CEXT_394431 [Caerostris extrusa]|uniref:Uncharacterized protein n=1 Tax=Caerostris extrusa TaxID=172846 RepID=A0AAV4TE55_CAEEX|nr:hypothetical protein CEXT_394431 [Caerostris extrusa]